MRIARLGALTDAGLPFGARCHHFSTSPSRNCWPACSRICARARRGSMNDQRQHVLQLVAEAERAAALIGADAAEQPRGHHLIGQPGVHEAVEVGPVGGHVNRCRDAWPNARGSPQAAPRRARHPPRRRR